MSFSPVSREATKKAGNSFLVPSGFSLAQRQKTEFIFLRNDSISLGLPEMACLDSELNGLLRVDSVSTDGKALGVGRYETVFENH